jgi:hypothetical protein
VKPEKRARFVERAALREAQKAMRKNPTHPLTREDLLELRVPTLGWPVRAFLIALGVLAVGVGVTLSILNDEPLMLFIGAVGIVAWPGITGYRKTLQSLAEGLGEAVLNGIVEAVLRGIVHLLD